MASERAIISKQSNLMVTSIGLLVVGAAFFSQSAEASSLERTDAINNEHLLNPRPRSDTELNNESHLKSGVMAPESSSSSLSSSSPSSSSSSQLAKALLRSRRWAFGLSSAQPTVQQQQQPRFIKSGPYDDSSTSAYYSDSQMPGLEMNKEALQRLLQLFEEYNRKKLSQPELLSAPAYYDKWLENNKDVAMDEVDPRATAYGARFGSSDPSSADYYPSSSQSFEKREHVKPCLFNAISCPKYPFIRNKTYK